MLIRSIRRVAITSICVPPLVWAQSAHGQQAVPDASAAPNRTTNATVTPQSVAVSDAVRKAEILDSECWHRAMFELNEWFGSQTIYTPEEVAKLRSDFTDRVDKMSVKELQDVISDMEAKFRILDTPEVQEVRAWFGQYMSVLAHRRREEVLREIPNFATMTPAQLNQEIMKIQRQMQHMRSSRAAFDRNREAQVEARLQANSETQTVTQNRNRQRSAYRSPYRPQSKERRFDNAQIGPRKNINVDPFGGIWMNLGL
jgi:hypothetical protein